MTHLQNRRRASREAGFSMVEFLVAAFIFSIGILGLTALQVTAIRQATSGRGRITATYVAEHVLQQAQVAGQLSYNAKLNVLNSPLASPFLANPGTAIAGPMAFGGFNVDGLCITAPFSATVLSPAVLTAMGVEAGKQNTVFSATWARMPYADTAPALTTFTMDPTLGTPNGQCQTFVVNVSWNEDGGGKTLSLSRNIRY